MPVLPPLPTPPNITPEDIERGVYDPKQEPRESTYSCRVCDGPGFFHPNTDLLVGCPNCGGKFTTEIDKYFYKDGE